MPLAYDDKKGYRHPMSEDQKNWEVLQMKKEQWEKMEAGQGFEPDEECMGIFRCAVAAKGYSSLLRCVPVMRYNK